MRVLVAPDKFAGTLTAVEAAEAIAAGWRATPPRRRARPGADVRRRPRLRRRAARRARRRAARGDGPRAARRRRCRPRCCVVGDDGVRRERPGLRAAPDRRRRTPRTRRRTAWASWSARPSTPAPPASWSGSAAAAPTTAVPGCWPRWARPPTRPWTRARAGLDGVDVGRPRPGRAALAGVRAGRRQRRGQPADRAVRRDQDLRPAEGHRRGAAARRRRLARAVRRAGGPPDSPSRRAPAPPAGSASRCCCSAPPGSPGSTWSPTPSACPDRARARRPGDHRRGRLRLLQPLRQGAVRRRRGRRGGAPAVRGAGRPGARRLPGDARARRRVGVLAGRPGGGGARLRATPPARSPTLAERVARTWSR